MKLLIFAQRWRANKLIKKINSWDKEEDDRVIIHTNWAIKNGAKNVVGSCSFKRYQYLDIVATVN